MQRIFSLESTELEALNRNTAQPRRYRRSLIAYRLLIFRFGRIRASPRGRWAERCQVDGKRALLTFGNSRIDHHSRALVFRNRGPRSSWQTPRYVSEPPRWCT